MSEHSPIHIDPLSSRAHGHGCLCRRQVLTGLAATGAGVGLSGCSTNKATGRTMFTGFYSREDEIEMGRKAHADILREFGGEYDNPRLARYVTGIGNTLAGHTEVTDLPYRFTVLNTPIVNAMALPGGGIYITRGLLTLASTEAEIAGVIGHEIGHVTARHTIERIGQSNIAGLGLAVFGILAPDTAQVAGDLVEAGAAVFIQGYSRRQELEADTLGIRYMARAGYDPDAMAGFLSKLRDHSRLQARRAGRSPDEVDRFDIMATHPRTAERVRAAMRQADTPAPPSPLVRRDAYLDAVNGMLFGDDPDQGLVRGDRFVHPALRFAFDIPDEVIIQNSPSAVTGFAPFGTAMIFDMGQGRTGDMRRYISNAWQPGARLSNLRSETINGLSAAIAETGGQAEGRAVDILLVAIAGEGNSIYRFLFLAPRGDMGRWEDRFLSAARSFERLSVAEAQAIEPLRLIVRPGSEIANLEAAARNIPYGRYSIDMIRLINDLSGNSIPADRRIKLVES